MKIELTPQQKKDQALFRAFVDKEIVPYADQFDQQECLPAELVEKLARQGYLSPVLPEEYGGSNMDMLTYGLLTAEVGRGCASVRNLLAVQGMVASAIFRWGHQCQKEAWLPKIASGEVVTAFALTEPNVGSDAKHVEATATFENNSYVLNGRKKWISYGQNADLFLVFTQCEQKPTAILVERNTPGFSTKPIFGLLGLRASMLAELQFDDCRVPLENRVGKEGLGFAYVASWALDFGRYSTAWGCVGLAQACLEACWRYTCTRQQFGVPLKDHQLIQEMMANMLTQVKAARLLCYHAGYLKDVNDPSALTETLIAKYFASTVATKVASDAVQIHGANGCGSEYPVQRYLRDAKIMEIIEGTTQIQQIAIAKAGWTMIS